MITAEPPPAASPAAPIPAFSKGRSHSFTAVKVIPATQPIHNHGTRKMNFNSQVKIFYRKRFQRFSADIF